MKVSNRLLSLLLAVLLLVVLLLVALPIPAAAADNSAAVNVRVNGHLVNFPDQQPIINSDSRTLIPVRFVAEQLQARVSWDFDAQTARIQKDGLSIALPIGSREMTVTDADGTHTVTMDTAAALVNNRTMVPIRFVAEALGAWVGYSAAFRTVQIYAGRLTPAEIEECRALAFQRPFCAENLKYKTGGTAFADLHEACFRDPQLNRTFTYRNEANGDSFAYPADPFENLPNFLAEYANGSDMGFGYSFDGVTAHFRTDASCIFLPPALQSPTQFTLYGYLTLQFAEDANMKSYLDFQSAADFGNVKPGGTYTYLIEVNFILLHGWSRPSVAAIYNRTGGICDRWN